MDLFEYHEVDLVSHFGVGYSSDEYDEKKEDFAKQFGKDLVKRLKELYKEELKAFIENEEELQPCQEDKEYYVNRAYVDDEDMKDQPPITEGERKALIKQLDRQMERITEKVTLYKNALESME